MIVNLLLMLGTHYPHPICHRTHDTTVLLFYGIDEEGERLLHTRSFFYKGCWIFLTSLIPYFFWKFN